MVGVINKVLEYVVLSVPEQAYSPPLVIQDRYRFDVGAFDIEAVRLHALEHRLHLLPKFVHLQSFLCIAV